MRKAFSFGVVCLALCVMLSGCGSKGEGASPEKKGGSLPATGEIVLDPVDWSPVEYRYSYASMKLSLPDSWEYSVTEYTEDGYTFGISFWPVGQTEGKIRLNYYPGMFGVCGTGLSQEEYTFSNGEKAYIGTYDNSPVWDFISFRNTAGDYAVINEGADVWWEDYKEEATAILHTIRLAEGMLSEEQVIELAKEHCTVEYDEVWNYFDFEEGIWKITFWVSDPSTAGGDQVVRLDVSGAYIDSTYGE